ncbi:MAG: multicopper oxidase domain-containing protein [Methylocystis sp.]|uniref:multicopper oxidase domain-containing protein n=1 Tax=Methylocystis sp. TaxID=1911079 RepID=UPI003DA2BD48
MRQKKLSNRKYYRSSLAALFLSASVSPGVAGAQQDLLREPQVFASENNVLDLVMVANARPVLDNAATGWVYSICRRKWANQRSCPNDASTVADYGGARLAVQPGDQLKIRLVNTLPKILDASHATGHHAYLGVNPTNLHTHGLIVEPRVATPSQPSFGDDVFLSVFNSANGGIPAGKRDPATGMRLDMHGSVIARDYVDYQIDIPQNHPLGSFFFHPHIHGISLNQISMGMSGIITVGRASDYAHGNRDNAAFSDANVRHLVLKDIQVQGNGVALSQQDPAFCDPAQPASAGSCAGVGDYDGGAWRFTVNGQSYPQIRVTSPEGEIWRITNSSGNVTYNLQIASASGQSLLTQLVSVDGVTISLPVDTPPDTVVKLAGGRFKVRPCPGAAPDALSLPACVSELTMMPSARAEIWVAYRDATGRVASTRNGGFVLKQKGLQMGSGDTWPAVNLASVTFAQFGAPQHVDRNLRISGDALKGFKATGIFRKKVPYADRAPLPTGCAALPPGHKRRIFFGIADQNDPSSFGMGYEQIDQFGNVVASQDVTQFDPANPFVCLPLDKGQKPANETWELVNLATENHNFHIHQTKFYQLTPTTSSPDTKGAAVMQDNLPLPVATPKIDVEQQGGACTMDQWHNGECDSKPVLVSIPFPQVGEFVYHCHILEHEDGGMMARIKVVPSPR